MLRKLCLLYKFWGEWVNVANIEWWYPTVGAAGWSLRNALWAFFVSLSIDTNQRWWDENYLPHEYAQDNVLFLLWVYSVLRGAAVFSPSPGYFSTCDLCKTKHIFSSLINKQQKEKRKHKRKKKEQKKRIKIKRLKAEKMMSKDKITPDQRRNDME